MSQRLIKVRDLSIGDTVMFNNAETIVKEVKSDRVMVTKEKGTLPFSIGFNSPQYEDLCNRVTLVKKAVKIVTVSSSCGQRRK